MNNNNGIVPAEHRDVETASMIATATTKSPGKGEKKDDDWFAEFWADFDKGTVWPRDKWRRLGEWPESTFAKIAGEWHSLGYNVIPGTVKKTPLVRFAAWSGPNGDYIPDELLEDWAVLYPDATPLLITGWHRDGAEGCPITVADADAPDMSPWIEDQFGITPFTVSTGRDGGGRHHWYRDEFCKGVVGRNKIIGPEHRCDWSYTINDNGEVEKPDDWGKTPIDIKSRRNYVVAPGSTHKTGRVYTASIPADIITLDWLRENLPIWNEKKYDALVQDSVERKTARNKAIQEEVARLKKADNTDNTGTITSLVGYATKSDEGTGNIPDENLTQEPFLHWCLAEPGNVGKDTWWGLATNLAAAFGEQGRNKFHKISERDSGRYNPKETDYNYTRALGSLSQFGPMTYAKLEEAGFPGPIPKGYKAPAVMWRAQHATSWPPLVPFGIHSVPEFPTSVLTPWHREYIKALAEFTQTPPDLAAMLSLSVVGLAAGGTVDIEMTPGYREPLNIFTVTALSPASRKSAVFSEVTKPIFDYEQELMKTSRDVIAEATTKRRISENTLQQLQNQAARTSDPTERSDLTIQAAEQAAELEKLQVPAIPRLVCDDSTPEALATLLSEQQGRIGVFSAEGGIFGMMAGRYTGAPNLEVFLKGHAGDALRVDRKGRPPEIIDHTCLTMGLAVQPAVINALADTKGFKGRGLLARFLYSMPLSKVGYRKTTPPLMQNQVTMAYHRQMTNLLTTLRDAEPKTLTLTSDAYQVWLAFYSWCEKQLRDGGELASIPEWGGKLHGAAGRIAGLVHLTQHANKPEPWGIPVNDDTMKAAVDIGRYLILHAQAAHDMMGTDPDLEAAKHLLGWISRNGCKRFTKREAHKANEGRFRRVVQVEAALSVLEERGMVRMRRGPKTDGVGRPPSPFYEVNPAVLKSVQDISKPADKIDTIDKKPPTAVAESISVDSVDCLQPSEPMLSASTEPTSEGTNDVKQESMDPAEVSPTRYHKDDPVWAALEKAAEILDA